MRAEAMTDTTNTAAAGQKMPRKPTGKLAFAYATIMQLEAQVAELRAAIAAQLEAIGAGGVNGPLMTPAPTSGAADLSAIISGAPFDFAGFLTTLDKSRAVTFSGAHEAGPAVTLLQEWSTKRGLILDDANVFDWSAALTAQAISQPGGFDAGDMASAAAGGYRDGWTAAQADGAEPAGGDAVAVVKRYIGGVVVHIVGDVKEGDSLYLRPTAPPADSVQEDAARSERERICAAIKVEDDYCVEQGDYMLDSDDCIKIARGDWVRPDFSVDAARKQGGA